ncbi:uncharacterized protein LOC130294893 [Hyla sarda]|uniref:uncharacterized protein LOC130294893 n=1 Tax=Hyla sarda TaxID=327740 RepID=UPI0024C34AAB|nr:uncharacterized protein LOC130294893 [Hyla sarda]
MSDLASTAIIPAEEPPITHLQPPEMRALMSILVNVLRRRRQRQLEARNLRRYWVHPINQLCDDLGHIGHLYAELRRYLDKFYNFVRMPMEAFDNLLAIVGPHLQRSHTHLHKAISPMERLLITLRFLATGESYASLHLQFRVGKSTISSIVKETCTMIWQYMQQISLPSPNQERWLQAASGFQSVDHFPNCIGAVDGKHIRVQQPPGSGSRFYNYKKYFSVVLMAVADVQYKFIAIEVGAYGSTGDSRVLMSSECGRHVLQNQVTLPPPKPLPATLNPLPYVFVSDEAFPLLPNLIRPYPQRGIDDRKQVFNQRLTQARHFVECAFGIMAGKWRILSTAIQLDVDTVESVIKATCVLHNYILDYASPDIEQEEHVSWGESAGSWGSGRTAQQAIVVREAFSSYFLSTEGAVTWTN